MIASPLVRKALLGASVAGLGYTYVHTRSRTVNAAAFYTDKPLAAICILQPDGGSGVRGLVTFSQATHNDRTRIQARVEGLKDGKHGFHVHEFGNLTQGCATAGPHYNPNNNTHGDIREACSHVGDMGNLVSKGGVAVLDIVDERGYIQLSGEQSIVGRSCVVHADEDDLGRGKFEDSKTTGHSGGRVSVHSTIILSATRWIG